MCDTFVISASYDRQIRFWDGSSGRTVRCFSFQDSQVNALLLIPNTTYLTVAGYGVVRIYDISATSSGKGGTSNAGGANQAPPLFSSYENQSAMNFTSLGSFPISSPNGVMPMSSSLASTSSVFNNTTVLAATQRPAAETSSDQVTVLYATSEDGRIRFFNAAVPTTLQVLRDISTGAAITCSALSPDRHTLLTGSQIGRVSVWHLPTIIALITESTESITTVPFGNKPLQEIAFENDYTAVRSIAIDPLARWAVTATNAGKLHFLRYIKSNDAETIGTSISAAVKPLCEENAFGEHVALSSSTHTTESVGLKRAQSTVQHSESIYRSALASNENVGNSLGNVAPFSGTSSSLVAALANSLDPGNVKVLNTSPHGASVPDDAANEKDKDVKNNLNDILSRSSTPQLSPLLQKFVMEVFHSFQAHYKYILKVAISPNADLLVTCCADYTVGRFVIPPDLQINNSTCNESPPPQEPEQEQEQQQKKQKQQEEESTSSSPGNELNSATLLPPSDACATDPFIASKVEGNTQDVHAAGELTQASSAVAATGGEDATAMSGEMKSLEVSQSAVQPNAPKETPQPVTEAKGTNTKRKPLHMEFNDASSLVSSMMPSFSGEGQDHSHFSGTTHFKALKPLTGHTRWVWDCVFSGCGQYLFTASSDHHLRMWNGLMSDRVQFTSFDGHTKPVVCCILYYEKKAPQQQQNPI